MAGRRVAGIGQLLLAVAGFVMVVGWFVLLALQTYEQLINDAQPKSVAWLGIAGTVTFVAAWLWSLFTSLSVLREARANEPGPVTPPVIIVVLGTVLFASGVLAETPRFVIDDEEAYVEKVTDASLRLLQDGKLQSLDSLRGYVQAEGFHLKPIPLSGSSREVCVGCCMRGQQWTVPRLWPRCRPTPTSLAHISLADFFSSDPGLRR